MKLTKLPSMKMYIYFSLFHARTEEYTGGVACSFFVLESEATADIGFGPIPLVEEICRGKVSITRHWVKTPLRHTHSELVLK